MKNPKILWVALVGALAISAYAMLRPTSNSVANGSTPVESAVQPAAASDSNKAAKKDGCCPVPCDEKASAAAVETSSI